MKTRYLAQLLLLSAVWGASFLLIRLADQAFPPAWVGLLRGLFGAALLWAVLLLGGKSLPPRRLLPWLLLVALTNNALPFLLFAWGEQVVPSSTAAVLNATTPIWTLLLSLSVSRARPASSTIVGVLLGFSGVALVVRLHAQPETARAHNEPALWAGVGAIALGAMGYAAATVIAKTKLRGLDPIGLATTQLTLAALMIAPVALFGPHPAHVPLTSLAAVLVLGFAGSGLAYLLYYSLLAHISATQVTAVTYLLPLWGMFWGRVAHEPVSTSSWVGVAIVIAGLVLLNRSAPPKIQPQSQAQESTVRLG
jgi:drug/metabolite transporter (DMT)-like permease